MIGVLMAVADAVPDGLLGDVMAPAAPAPLVAAAAAAAAEALSGELAARECPCPWKGTNDDTLTSGVAAAPAAPVPCPCLDRSDDSPWIPPPPHQGTARFLKEHPLCAQRSAL